MWFIVAVLLGISVPDVEQMRMVGGPLMTYESCVKVAEGIAKEAKPPEDKKVRFGCVYVKPDKRIVM